MTQVNTRFWKSGKRFLLIQLVDFLLVVIVTVRVCGNDHMSRLIPLVLSDAVCGNIHIILNNDECSSDFALNIIIPNGRDFPRVGRHHTPIVPVVANDASGC